MKNIFKKTAAFLLACLATFSVVGASACKDPKKDSSGGDETVYDNPNHNFTAPDTDKDLIANGKTEYTLVYPAESTSYESTARQEFINLFREATGIKMNAIPDTGLTYDESKKYISLGDTTLLASSGLTIDKDALSSSGVRIVTKGNTVFLSGGEKQGVIYSVYDFMSIMFDYETYYIDCMVIDKNVKNAKLKAFDVTNIPDFKDRVRSYATYRANDSETKTFVNRMRMNSSRSNRFPMYKNFNSSTSPSKTGHNTDTILPRETYKDTHGDWFSDNGNQLCYTAHGNAEEWDLMVEEIVKKCFNSLQFHTEASYPDYDTFDIVMEDNEQACTCTDCLAETAKYGAASGSVVKVINEVSRRFKKQYAELKAANPDSDLYTRDVDDFKFQFYSYLQYVAAPTVQNAETGEWSASAPEMELEDNVVVQLALTNLSTFYSITNPDNINGKNTVDSWAALTDNLAYWIYTTNFHFYLYPWYDFTFMNGESYGYFAEKSDYSMYSQSIVTGEGAMTNWYNLRMYVDAKLQWDTSLDVDVLVDNWFNAMYKDKETVSIMKSLYEDNVTLARAVISQYGTPFNFMGSYINILTYWPYQMLEGWLDRYDMALASIEKYKGTADYEVLRGHIEVETVSPLYMMMDLHSVTMSKTKKTEIVDRLLNTIEDFGLYKMKTKEAGSVYVYDLAMDWKNSLQ